jgi:hypothetical protein
MLTYKVQSTYDLCLLGIIDLCLTRPNVNLQSTKYKVQSTKYKVQSTKYIQFMLTRYNWFISNTT